MFLPKGAYPVYTLDKPLSDLNVYSGFKEKTIRKIHCLSAVYQYKPADAVVFVPGIVEQTLLEYGM